MMVLREVKMKEREESLERGEGLLEVEVEFFTDLLEGEGFGYTKRSIGGRERYFLLKRLERGAFD